MVPRSRTDIGTFARVEMVDRFWNRVDKDTEGGCWEWTGRVEPTGYAKITDFWDKHYVHRFSYELHFGPIPEGLHVCHTCDNRRCVRPDHLFLGTPKDNTQDALAKGRLTGPRVPATRVGSANNMARLTEDDVRIIRATHAAGGVTMAYLARRFGVSEASVSNVVKRKTWRHI